MLVIPVVAAGSAATVGIITSGRPASIVRNTIDIVQAYGRKRNYAL